MRVFLLWCAILLGLGCARPEPKKSPPGTAPSSAPSPELKPPAASTTTNQAATLPPAPPGPAECSADKDCAWDDPCLPARCIGALYAPKFLGCEKSTPPPGECGCKSRRCTLTRKDPPPPVAAGCQKNSDCGVDLTSGACVKKDQYTSWPEKGSYCRCEVSKGECSLEEIAPVPCKSYKDCSWEYDPLRAVPSTLKPRPSPKPVKPCSNGEHDSVCKDGVCEVVAWKC